MSDVTYKVQLALGGDLPGDRLCALLEAIGARGSINRAAAELKLSYRYAWGLLREAEGRLGAPLLAKRVGGAAGGGAELTPVAHELLEHYRRVQVRVAEALEPAGGQNRDALAVSPVLLATTIGPAESGIVAALEEGFFRATGLVVRHIAAGTGQALQVAREGRVDLVLAHAPELEEAFVADGFGTGRHPLMANEFLLLGPAHDPAGAATAGNAVAAFGAIAAAGAPFVSRGDRSGTHVRELELWRQAGATPAAPWYAVSPLGSMGSRAALEHARALNAYVLVDRATYLDARQEGLNLAVVHAGGPELQNLFALLPVSSRRFPGVHAAEAARFVEWATGPAGREIIAGFGLDRFGEPLFVPA